MVTGEGDNILTNAEFTADNFLRIFDSKEFLQVLWATVFYTVFGTIGALVVGLFAALLLNKSFVGKGVLRGLYLFPYVSPIIAVAFTWVTLFDPFSGSINALLIQMNVTEEPINFLRPAPACAHHGDGIRNLALLSVVVPVHSGANAIDR